MSSPEDLNPRRVRWTWRTLAAIVVIAAYLLVLNAVYSSGHEIVSLVLLAVGLIAPGAWQVHRGRSRD